jgi:osmotically-inducible protein OsmY
MKMRTDIEIQKDVIDELRWQPGLESSRIGVAVKTGIVTLSGQVDTYSQKIDAEKAAKKIKGVKVIAEDMQVGVSAFNKRTDAEIAAAILDALKWQSAVDEEKIKVKVEDGIAKLQGEVEWEYQRILAQTAVQHISGLKMLLNEITVKPVLTPQKLEQQISAAFERNALLDAQKITAQVIGGVVTLRGTVRSFTELEDAEDAAWAAPGVTRVKNELDVAEPDFTF